MGVGLEIDDHTLGLSIMVIDIRTWYLSRPSLSESYLPGPHPPKKVRVTSRKVHITSDMQPGTGSITTHWQSTGGEVTSQGHEHRD
jgi:hypothetical protein